METTVLTIGIDLGGTRVRVASVDPKGRVISMHAWDHTLQSADAFIADITPILRDMSKPIAHSARAVRAALRDCSAPLIGLAVAGVIDVARQCVTRSVNLPWLEGVPIAERFRESIGQSVRLFTDAEAATWAEFSEEGVAASDPPEVGRAHVRRFAHLRLGTGAGLGVVVNAALLPFDPHRTTHLEALVVDRSEGARLCRCGLRGCLETVASGPVLIARASAAGINRGLVELNEQAISGEPEARAIVDEAAQAVERAIEHIVNTWHVDVVSLGGGVIEHLPILFDRVAARFHSPAVPNAQVRVMRARLGDQAGCIGAARLAAGLGAVAE
jgi:glucokinase